LSPQKPRSKKGKKSKSSSGHAGAEAGDYVRVKLPNKKKGEIFGIADQLLGASHIKVMCADSKSRMARIPGKMKKRMWIREGDLIIIRPWSFQDEKADVVWRYTKTQASYLSRKKMIPDIINIF
jgi:translation initiation factor 1A